METDCPTLPEQRNISCDQVKQLFKTNVLLLFPETYDDLAVPLLPLHSNIEDDDNIDDDANLRALVAGSSGRSAEPSKLKSPKKGGRKVDGHLTSSLVPDVVLELEQSDAANERGHLVIAIDNPNPDLAVKIVVRFWGWLSSFWQVLTLLFT